MANRISKTNGNVSTHYLEQTDQREIRGEVTLDQVPFFLASLRQHPAALRRQFLEAILAVIWETTVVDAGDTYTVGTDDVVILAGSTGATPTEILLPAISDGRVLIVKDKDGLASINNVLLHVDDPAAEKIDDAASTTVSINADYSAVVIVAESTASKWYIFATI